MDKYITSQHYSELLSQIEKLREENDILKANYRKESIRANALQKDLDAIDDFNALVESEISRSLSHRKPS